ncbi:MAG: hypothetical protein JSV72_17530, partial [Ralstonia sp.]
LARPWVAHLAFARKSFLLSALARHSAKRHEFGRPSRPGGFRPILVAGLFQSPRSVKLSDVGGIGRIAHGDAIRLCGHSACHYRVFAQS